MEVKIISWKNSKKAAASLAAAFHEDEVSFHFLATPDNTRSPEQNYKIHTKIMEYTVKAHCLNGVALSIGDNHEGVALWKPPGKNMDDWYTIFRSGMWKLWFILSPLGRKRWFSDFLPQLHQTK